MMENVDVMPISPENVSDRLELCWDHLNDWRNLDIVQKSKKWLEMANGFFTPTTLIAYKGGTPLGMIEFVPQRFMRKRGLCPCRVDAKSGETENRYTLGKEFENYLFISCLFVGKDQQGKGVGKSLLNNFLHSKPFTDSDGALVYVTQRDKGWDKFIHWPAGSREFYLKAGFVVEKTLVDPTGYVLRYRQTDR